MTRRSISAIAIVGALLLTSCVEDSLVVRLDLCPGPDATSHDLDTIRSSTSWTIEVWRIENDDAYARRTFGGLNDVTELDLTDAIPTGDAVRLLVEGRGVDSTGEQSLMAIGASNLLVLQGGEELCLCIAPPESYEDLCEIRSCSVDTTTNECMSLR